MLQEIIDRITAPGKTALGKIQSLLYEATVGLLLDYQKKAMELVHITAASCYLQSVKALRQAAAVLFLVTLATVVFAVAVVIVPIAVILVCPWTAWQKAVGILAFGFLDMAAALFYLTALFSEERWMKMTRSQEIIDKIKNL